MNLRRRVWFLGVSFCLIGFVILQQKSSTTGVNLKKDELWDPKQRKPSFLLQDGVCHNRTIKRSIFYIKTQKTASSTIKSSLLNYGLKHQLRICLDNTDLYHMNFPYAIDELKLTKTYDSKCEMIADELVFDKLQATKLMSGDPIFIASVREPIKHFISLYKFARIHDAVQLLTLLKLEFWDSMRIFLKNSKLVRNIYNTFNEKDFPDYGNIANLVRPNLQAFSLGISPEAREDEIVAKFKDLDFIVVAEQYFESMVLLAKELCCPFEDLVFVHQNIQRTLPEEKDSVPQDVIDLIMSYNEVDFTLYEMARKRLEKLKFQSKFMKEDTEAYKNVIKHYASQCEVARQPLAKVDGNYCLPEEATYFYQLVRENVRKDLLEKLQKKYDNLNPLLSTAHS